MLQSNICANRCLEESTQQTSEETIAKFPKQSRKEKSYMIGRRIT